MTGHRNSEFRRGFTILELLLVLALLVTVASLAATQVGRTLDSHRLRNGGEQIRVVWSKARVRAMEDGRTYVFRHELGGNRYVVEPWLTQDDYLESSQLMIAGDAASAATAGGGYSEQRELPENVLFAETRTAEDSRGAVLQLSAASPADETNWSSPLFFYPDGTTSTAKLRVVNTRQRAFEVSMRGLTGVVYVKPVSANEAAGS